MEVNNLANTKSAEKRINVSAKKKLVNSSKKSALRKVKKSALVAIESNSTNKNELIMDAMKATDKAVGDGLIHKNKAAREKSRLAKALK